MSVIQRAMDDFEYRQELISALSTLQDLDLPDHDSAKGIVRQLVEDGDVDSLTPKQFHVFDKYIEPLVERYCDECGTFIEIGCVPGALLNESGTGYFLCDSCIHDVENYS